MPTIAGSILCGDDTTLVRVLTPTRRSALLNRSCTGPFAIGTHPLTIAVIRFHSHDQRASTRQVPHNHNATITAEDVSEIDGSADEVNTTFSAADARSSITVAGNSTLAAWLNRANGTTNFIEAANQIQNRTEARLFLSNDASAAATSATIVDCQM
jgi:hypothetical protein